MVSAKHRRRAGRPAHDERHHVFTDERVTDEKVTDEKAAADVPQTLDQDISEALRYALPRQPADVTAAGGRVAVMSGSSDRVGTLER